MEIVTKQAFEMVSDEEIEESTHFFEGAEKLLEIWFNKEANPMSTSLRTIPLTEIEALLEIACCHILHFRSNGHLDSYVLSESSMFISDTRIILKTCGNTKLLESIDRLLELAKTYANMDTVANVYYSRKNFLRPELQPFIHQNFENEVEHLDNFFEEGAAYCMGSLKQHRWYLYTMSAPEAPSSPFPDHTLEICMTKIPENILRIFSRETCKNGAEATRRGGIDKLVPSETIIHEELFDPVGYSMNGLLPNSDEYITIHITPEPDFCYISFETNQRQECLYQQTLKVLQCFQPNEFLITVFANDKSKAAIDTQLEIWNQDLPGYRRASLQFLRLQFDTLVYAQFVRRDAKITVKYLPKKRKLVACSNTDTEDEDSTK